MTLPRSTLSELLGLIQKRLEPVAPSSDGETALANLDSPPRLVWVVKDAQTSQKGTGQGPTPSRRILAWDLWRVEIHAWGEDIEAALELRRCLVEATIEILGRRFRFGRTWSMGGASYNTHGHAIVSELHFPNPLQSAPIGTTESPPGKASEIGTAIALDTIFDETIGTAGDGGLSTGED